MPNLFSWLRRVAGIHVVRVLTRPLNVVDASLATPSPLTFRLCEPAELQRWSADAELDLQAAKVAAAVARGDRCVGAFDGARLIGYVWYAFAETPHNASVSVRIPGSARYAYKGFIRESCRGKGLGKQLYERAGAVCPREGRTLGVTYIYVDNLPSLRPAEKAGWRTAGFAGYVGKGGVFLPFVAPAVRRLGFGFFRPAPAGRSSGWLSRTIRA